MAVRMVSASRISPSRITSGAWRRQARRAERWSAVSVAISRWLMMHCWSRCRYSMGSSRVMIWAWRVRLIRSIRQARVVDLPLSALPVTSTMPWRRADSSITWGGMCSASQSGMWKATTRITAAREPRCR